jgi:polyisoprenoid-binding protein YceI
MRFILIATALFASACATTGIPAPAAVAQTQASGSPVATALPQAQGTSLNPAEAPAGAYTLDSRHASVLWRIRHMGLGLFTARFDTLSGTLNFDPAHPENSSINVTIAANSVNTGVLNADGQRAFDHEIANNVLGAEANPNITFVSRSIQLTGPTTGLITGDLTLHGQTHPVTLEASFEGGRFVQFFGKHVIAFSGRTMIDRSQWGASFANPVINGTTGNMVEILIAAEFRKD